MDSAIHKSPTTRRTNFVQKGFLGFGFATVAPPEIFRKISQSFSTAGVSSPLAAQAMPIDDTSVVSVIGR